MFIIIPAERSLKVTGDCQKSLTCEMCEQEFSYVLQRTVVIRQGFFSLNYSDRAVFAELQAKGEKKLASILEKTLDVSPCEYCGWVQQSMIDYRKKHEFRWMKTFALISLLSGIALGIMFGVIGIKDRIQDAGYYYFAAMVANTGIFCCLVLLGLRWLSLRLTDPNRDYGHVNDADSASANDDSEPQQ